MAENATAISTKESGQYVEQHDEVKPAGSEKSSGDDELVTVEKGYAREELHEDLSPEEAHRALRKCDYRLIPLLGLLYLVAFIDRSNIGNARIAGMEDDLQLEGMQYNIAVCHIHPSEHELKADAGIGDHVLRVLRLLRSTQQHRPEAHAAQHLDRNTHVLLGLGHDAYGSGKQCERTICGEILSG